MALMFCLCEDVNSVVFSNAEEKSVVRVGWIDRRIINMLHAAP